jgi:hypothetical protein
LQGYNRLFGAFFANVKISNNRPTSTSRKIGNQPLISQGAASDHWGATVDRPGVIVDRPGAVVDRPGATDIAAPNAKKLSLQEVLIMVPILISVPTNDVD